MVFLFLLLTLAIALLVDFIKTRRTAEQKLDRSFSNSFSEKDSLILPRMQTDQPLDTSVYRTSAHMVA